MANWSLPTLTDLYTNFRQYLSDRLDDAAKMFDSATTTPTNQPVGTKRWNSTSNKFEKWSGSAWSDLASTYGISISGNAATATTAATAGSVTTVTSANITSGLGYTPLNAAGGTMTGGLSVAGLIYGGSGLTVAGNMYASGTIQAAGAAQFNSTMTVNGAVTVGGAITSNGQIATNNSALRANGWGGDYNKGLYFFGANYNYLYYNGSAYEFCGGNGGWYAHITKGGTVAMTSDIPAAGVSKDATAYEIGSIIMGVRSSSTEVLANGTASGIIPCNAAGASGTNPATTGTWRCLGYSNNANKITCWQRIL